MSAQDQAAAAEAAAEAAAKAEADRRKAEADLFQHLQTMHETGGRV